MEQFLAPLIGGVELFFVPSVALALVGGMVWGSIGGAMPGFNQTLSVGVMVPFTFAMGPVEAVAFLVAIGVGVSYGNSIPAILVGLPGTPSAVLTALDGHALHKRGESGLALGVSYFAAVFGQFVSSFFFILMVVPLSQLAYHFLAPELFALHMLGITAIVSLTGKNVIKGIVAAAFGLRPHDHRSRPDRQQSAASPSASRSCAAGCRSCPWRSACWRSARSSARPGRRTTGAASPDRSRPSSRPGRSCGRTVPAVAGGTVIGMLVGSIPGMGGAPAAAVAYQQARLISKQARGVRQGQRRGRRRQRGGAERRPVGRDGADARASASRAATRWCCCSARSSIHGIVAGPLLATQTPGDAARRDRRPARHRDPARRSSAGASRARCCAWRR